MTTFDVAVIGGGPAGCSAAITLAEQGQRVALFEAKTYPHHKVCGEFLSPECMILLDRLGLLTALADLRPVPIQTVCMTAPSGAVWETTLPGTAWGISRSALDAALAQQARICGVEVCEGTTISDIGGSLDSGFQLIARTPAGNEVIEARLLIGAHGKRSGLDRTLNRAFLDHSQPFVGLKAHFHGPPLPGRIELHTFPGGYCGMSEIEGGAANVCLLVRQTVFQRAAGNGPAAVQDFIVWMRGQNAHLESWLSQADMISDRWLSIGQVPFIRKQAVEQDILMAGDAAGLIVPLAGDGIAMALHSGKLAAAYGAAFLTRNLTAFDLRQQYAAAWQHEFGSRLKLGRALQGIMLRPHLLSPTLRLLSAVPPLGNYLVAHTRDTKLIHQTSAPSLGV